MALDKLKPASYSAISYENGRVFYKKTLGGENVGKEARRRRPKDVGQEGDDQGRRQREEVHQEDG